MSNRNQYITHLAGIVFNGTTTEDAAATIMQWKKVDRHLSTPNGRDKKINQLPEHEKLEIPAKINYLDSYGKGTSVI